MCNSCKQIWPSGEYRLFPVGMQGRHFTHLKTGQPCEDRTLLLTAILADAINLGIAKMAEACPGTTARKLDWLASLHIRDETNAMAIAELVNHHHRHAFAEHWGEGKTSSSDG